MEKPDYTIKRSDVGKKISGQFLDGNLNAVDCTGNSARAFWVRDFFTNAAAISGVDFVIDIALQGTFHYFFTSQDLLAMTPAPRAGRYFKAEFKVTLASGALMTTPTKPRRQYLIIKFEDDLS